MMKWKKAAAALLALVVLVSFAAGALAGTALVPGDMGEKVKELQERLEELGYLQQGYEEGVMDGETVDAVRRFQAANGLLASGMVDDMTWSLLFSEKALREETEMLTEEVFDDGLVAMKASLSQSAPGMTAAENAWNTEEYSMFAENGFRSASLSPLSTFAADVDTSSYSHIRSMILRGEKVPAQAVRIEEMLNYFHYDYPQPEQGEPFGVYMGLAPCPWNGKTKLVQIGLQAADVQEEEKRGCNLVFLIDTSGSMEGADRLDLVKRAFLLLLDELKADDTVSIVAYASQDRVVLDGAKAGEKTRIMEAISDLEAGGYTNGSAGLLRAYEIAQAHFVQGGINRILLATDGDLNVGVTSEGELARLVTEKKASGIALTVLGFGYGNYKDNKLEALADYGDGNCFYIDTILEARRALVTEAGGTFRTVARDVKLQVDFNPAFIEGYRLIGYEDRLMAPEEFDDDARDGGEVGSGHRVTVLYEVVPAGSDFDFPKAQSRYQGTAGDPDGSMLTLNVRAKTGDSDQSTLYVHEMPADMPEGTDDNLPFAAAVAEVGMLLRDSEWKGTATYEGALELLRGCGQVTGDIYKEEFLYLTGLLARKQ